MGKHYIAMSGSHGCLPDYCECHVRKSDAVSDLVSLFELDDVQERMLFEGDYLELRGAEDGAAYCEIVVCECDDPSIHSDG